MAAYYSLGKKTDDAKININLPFYLKTGQVNEKIWKKWKIHDPIYMVDKFKHNLKNLDLLFFYCGLYDEFNLFIGTKVFSEKYRVWNRS